MISVTFSCFHMQSMESRNSSSQRIIGLSANNVKVHCISNTVVSFRFKFYRDCKHVFRLVGKLTLDLYPHRIGKLPVEKNKKFVGKTRTKNHAMVVLYYY